MRENEYGISALSGKTNMIVIPVTLPYGLLFFPIGLLEASSKYIYHLF